MDRGTCNVEYDSTGEGIPECCTGEEHPVCAECLEACKILCAERREGVKYCFGDNESLACECTIYEGPTCYKLPKASTSSTLPPEPIRKGPGIGFYFLIFVGSMLLLIILINVVAKI